jgi:hypothetical protein
MFDPPLLDFGDQAICRLLMRTINPNFAFFAVLWAKSQYQEQQD